MEVILLKDVDKLGKKHEVRSVSSGYARNFLIPRGLAEIATDDKIKQASIMASRKKTRKIKGEKQIHKIRESLANLHLNFKVKATDKGGLFAGIHPHEIAEEIERVKGIKLAKDQILMAEPIKNIGEYDVNIKFGDNSTLKLKVKVINYEKK